MTISFISNFCDIFQEIQFLPLTAALRCSSLLSSVHILKHCLLPHFQYAAVPRRRSKMDERLNLRFETFDAINPFTTKQRTRSILVQIILALSIRNIFDNVRVL